MGETKFLRVGFPFRGFFARGAKHEAPEGFLTGDSHDWDFRPRTGKWKRRNGSSIVGDTLSAGVEVTGLLPAKWSAKAREVFELISSSSADGQPTHAALYTNESSVWGQVYFRDTNGADTNETLGGNYASDYPAGGATTPNRLRMVPLYTDHSLVFTRCVDEKQRRLVACGTRKSAAFESYRYFPNAQGTPMRWDHGFNDSTVSSNVQRILPWGHIPPCWTPDFTLPAATTTGNESWTGTNRFAYSVAFRFEDGSIGRPFIPRPITAVAKISSNPDQNNCGWVDMLHATGANKYTYIQWNNIPKGPPGTISRILLRTVVTDQSGQPSLATLGVVDEIFDNSTTTYKDYGGGLTPLLDATNIRIADHKWPRRGRYVFSYYGHVAVCGKLKPNPMALIVGPRKLGGSMMNYDDSIIGSVIPWVCVREDQVSAGTRYTRLLCGTDATTPSAGILLTSSVTLNDVLDSLLASKNTDTASTIDDWKGQIVPGANGFATADNLQITQVYAVFDTVLNNATLTIKNGGDGNAGSTTNIVVGMKITGTGIAAGSYVGSKTSTTVVMVDSAGASKLASANGTGINLRIGWDFGDNYPGEARVNTCAMPFCIPFNSTYLATLPTADRDVDFTSADSGHAKYAVQSFYVKNRRPAPRILGIAMGGGEVQNGALVCYSKGLAALINTRGGNTNADDDWQLQPVDGSRGTISPEIVQANFAIVRWTPHGIEVNDGARSAIISEAIYDPSEKTGEIAYEIAQCKYAARSDTDGYHAHMMLADGILYVSYRSSASYSTYPDRYMKYDCSPSLGLSGVEQFLDENGKPFPWGTPQKVRVSCMAEVQRSDRAHRYGTIEGNGGTGDGRIDEFDIPTQVDDNATAVVPVGYTSMLVDREGLMEFSVLGLRIKYAKAGTGLTIGLSRDKNRGATDNLTLDTSGSNEFTLRRLPATENMRKAKEALEFVLADDGSGGQPEIEGFIAEYEEVDNYAARR